MTKDEALKLALEALEFYYDMHEEEADAKAITAIKEALAQPEQEPFMASYEFNQYGYYKDEKGILKLGNIQAAQPPQRTWVGLTDEEIWGAVSRIGTSNSDVNPYAILKDARAIEAKLKEKNT